MGPVATNTLSPALFTNVFIFFCLPPLLSLLLRNSALSLEKQWVRPRGAELLLRLDTRVQVLWICLNWVFWAVRVKLWSLRPWSVP